MFFMISNDLLVGGLVAINFIFPYIGNNHPNWLSYFSEGFKPPTSLYRCFVCMFTGVILVPIILFCFLTCLSHHVQNVFWWLCKSIWWFPEIGVPPNHPFLDGIFHYKASFLGIPPFMEPPISIPRPFEITLRNHQRFHYHPLIAVFSRPAPGRLDRASKAPSSPQAVDAVTRWRIDRGTLMTLFGDPSMT